MKFLGYRRENGTVGVRNHLLVIPASVCASEVAGRIASHVNGATYIPNQHGCCQIRPDLELTKNILIGLGKNPNVAAVLIVGLGCEAASAKQLAKEISETGKVSEYIIIKENEGTLNTEVLGIRMLRKIAKKVCKMKREEIDISEITIAIECSDSDTTSGMASNQAVCYTSDKLVDLGATSIFSETIGAEHILAKRVITEEVENEILKIVSDCENNVMNMGVNMRKRRITAGNMQEGLKIIEEKSLGCTYKSRIKDIKGVLKYGQTPKDNGLYIMDTPGQDIESITGMTAGGAQIVIFNTSRGTPIGCPIAPVIKVTGNCDTFKIMKDNIDINSGTIIGGYEAIADVGERIFKEVIEVAEGDLTKSEALNHKEFGMYKLISTF